MPAAKAKKKTLATLAAVHSRDVVIPAKIRAAFAKMKANGDDYEYAGDFCKLAGISFSDLGAYREKFEAHIASVRALGTTNGKRNARDVWFHDVKSAEKVRTGSYG